MTVVKRRTAVLTLGVIIAIAGALSGCDIEKPPATSAYSVPAGTPTPYVLPTPGATATATASPTPTPTKSATKAAPKPAASPTAKQATPAPKASTAATKASTAAPKTAPTKSYPSITLGKLAWSGHGCLYRWSGSGWRSDNLCRTPRVEPRDYTYTNALGHKLFSAATNPATADVWWTDALLQYQQYTNSAPNTQSSIAFGRQEATWNGIDDLSLRDFFADTTAKDNFQQSHPTANLTKPKRDAQWQTFRYVWWPAISAQNCTKAYLCP